MTLKTKTLTTFVAIAASTALLAMGNEVMAKGIALEDLATSKPIAAPPLPIVEEAVRENQEPRCLPKPRPCLSRCIRLAADGEVGK